MSGLESMHISVPDTNDYYSYKQPRGSISSTTSSSSLSPGGMHSASGLQSPLASPREWGSGPLEQEPQRRSTKRGVSTFISKLYSMISGRNNQHLISWNPSGTSFLVCNATRFAQELLPEHFKHSNFSSFVRQLNMYGFHKINKSSRGQRGNNENEIWEFSHTKFQRGRPDLLEDIKRKAMDSELLRRETGDIHASFAMVQLSQADLLQQFRGLQENFSNLLQGFEDMKKIQLQQQIIIRRLAERQGIQVSTPLAEFENKHMLNDEQPRVFVTSPGSGMCGDYGQPTPSWEMDASNRCPPQMRLDHQLPPPATSTQQDMMMSMYATSSANNTFSFPTSTSTTLPPSPVPSVLLSSPSSCVSVEQNDSRMKFDNPNNVGGITFSE